MERRQWHPTASFSRKYPYYKLSRGKDWIDSPRSAEDAEAGFEMTPLRTLCLCGGKDLEWLTGAVISEQNRIE